MKHFTLVILVLLLSTNSMADDKLLGTWAAKDYPTWPSFRFAKNNDFFYYYADIDSNINMVRRSTNGVWETGTWNIKNNKTGVKRTCTLTVYAKSAECCFSYKFIGSTLILTSEYQSGSHHGLCTNKVLIPFQTEK